MGKERLLIRKCGIRNPLHQCAAVFRDFFCIVLKMLPENVKRKKQSIAWYVVHNCSSSTWEVEGGGEGGLHFGVILGCIASSKASRTAGDIVSKPLSPLKASKLEPP